jgi:hypothetical protein
MCELQRSIALWAERDTRASGVGVCVWGGGGSDTTSKTTAWCKLATTFGRAVGCLCAISTTFKTSPLCSTRASLLYVLLRCNIPRVMRVLSWVLGCIDPTLPSRRSPQTAPRLALPRRHRCEQKPCRCGSQKKESSACVAEGRKRETCHSVVCVHKAVCGAGEQHSHSLRAMSA